MKKVSWLLLGLICMACTRTVYVPVAEKHTVYTTLRDTVVTVVTEGEQVSVATRDTVSRLSCATAVSEAIVSQGVLSHTLTTLPRRDSVAVQLREFHTVDSVPYVVPVPAERVIETPRWAWWSLGAVLLQAVVIGCFLFRRK